jgi:hydroxymethylpyrimidine pyrophosphatase-like HAD family hydrolase
MQYKILASDYDNTLVPFGEKQPRPAMVKAVKKLQAAGGKFVLSTGRAWSAINRKGQLGGIRFDYAITCNGACVVDKNGAIVAEHPMTSEEMYALVDFCEDYNYPLQFNFKDAYYVYCEYDILHKHYDQMNSVGLRGRRRPGPPPHRYASRSVLPLPRGGAGAVQRKVRPPRPSLHADGRPAARRLPLL